MDPKQMAKMMQQMGIKSEELDVTRVTIEKSDGSRLLVEPASVTKIEMRGQSTFQVAGVVIEQKAGEGGEREKADADIVAEQAGVPKEVAEAALKESGGDMAEAIMALEKRKG